MLKDLLNLRQDFNQDKYFQNISFKSSIIFVSNCSLFALSCAFVPPEIAAKEVIGLKLQLFAYAPHFQEDPVDLGKQLSEQFETNFDEFLNIFDNEEFTVNVDFDIEILDINDISYNMNSKPLYLEHVKAAMENSEKINSTKANVKMLLLPTTRELYHSTEGGGVAGMAWDSK